MYNKVLIRNLSIDFIQYLMLLHFNLRGTLSKSNLLWKHQIASDLLMKEKNHLLVYLHPFTRSWHWILRHYV